MYNHVHDFFSHFFFKHKKNIEMNSRLGVVDFVYFSRVLQSHERWHPNSANNLNINHKYTHSVCVWFNAFYRMPMPTHTYEWF